MTTTQEYFETNRNRSALVRAMIEGSDTKTHMLAQTLGISDSSFRTKLYRNSFTYDQVLLIADTCGFKIEIVPKVAQT